MFAFLFLQYSILFNMETISITVYQDDVYNEVAKATDYTGTKLLDADPSARERILATDEDLSDLVRFWEEASLTANERLKTMLVSGSTQVVTNRTAYIAVIEVSKSFDKSLAASVEKLLHNFFIASIIAQWFKLSNKGEANDYFAQSSEMITATERLLYSRKRPSRPTE